MSIVKLLEDTLKRWNSGESEDHVTQAIGFWVCYPQFHEQTRLCEDPRNAERALNHVHLIAVNMLMRLAEEMSLDSGAISTCGAICRESFSSGRRKSFTGKLGTWPECIGDFRYEFPEHEQRAIRAASEIIERMNAQFGIERDESELDDSEENSSLRKRSTEEETKLKVYAAIQFKMKNPEWTQSQCSKEAGIPASTLSGRPEWQEWNEKIRAANINGNMEKVERAFDQRLGKMVEIDPDS